jgi:hypothetical protein
LPSNSGKAKASSTTTKSKPRKSTPPVPSRAEQARAAAESAVDVPVGAVLEVSDRVAELVEPFNGRSAAQKQLKSYGTKLRRTVKRTERRGATARRKAATEARKTIERRTSRAQELVDQVGEQLASLR